MSKPTTLLKEQLTYLYEMVIKLDHFRKEISKKIGGLPSDMQSTYDRFDYKWKAVLDDARWNPKEYQDQLIAYFAKPKAWFVGKKVLDAGCGDGRYSEAFCALGATVVSVDISVHGVEKATALCSKYDSHKAYRWDLLQPLEEKDFDIVWSHGVLHHTGDTETAMNNVMSVLKPGGSTVFMLYGYPNFSSIGHLVHDNKYMTLHREYQHLSNGDFQNLMKKEYSKYAHGGFDAATPVVEDHYTLAQTCIMANKAGLINLRRFIDGRHHVVYGEKA
jgi:SAM-dependent methyltransferase